MGDSVNTAPRSELCACLVSSRIYCLIQEQLQTFLEQFEGKVHFQILGDSLIVLNQIRKNSYNFHTYAAARIQEIRESTLGNDIEWAHVASENNLADILTRSYSESPEDLPWAKNNMNIDETCLTMSEIPIPCLPDADKKQILHGTIQSYSRCVKEYQGPL